MRKIKALLLLLALIVSLLVLSLPAPATAKTIVVPDDYATIQAAVESASNGDTISVKAGRYFGNIIVDKSVQIIGESPDSTTVYSYYVSEEDRSAFQVNAPNVVIANLTIPHDDWNVRSIEINANDCEVRNNVLSDSIYGEDCSNVNIVGNQFNGSIYLENISGGTISKNIMLGMPMRIESSSDIVVSDNDISKFILTEVDDVRLLDRCNNCLLENNKFGSGRIYIQDSSHCSFIDNTAPNIAFRILGSPSTQLKRNSFKAFTVTGDILADYMHDIDTSNTINGKPICYLMNRSDLEISPATYPNIGVLYIVNSKNIKVNKLNLDTCEIFLVFTTDSEISENNLTNYGIQLTLGSNRNLISKNNLDKAIISIVNSSSNSIVRNVLNQNPIILNYAASGNTVVGNTILNSHRAFFVFSATDNTIYHNNLIGYSSAVSSDVPESANTWTDGYPGGGNYWGYTGTDEKSGPGQSLTGPDAIIDSAKQGGDVYPLAAPVEFIDSTGQGTPITLEFITNSTITNLTINDATKEISFNATGEKDTTGFSRVTIPNSIARDAWNSEYSITVNNQEVTFTTLTDNANTYSYVTFQNQAEPTPSFPPEEPTPSPSSSPSQEATSSPPPDDSFPLSQVIIIALAATLVTALVAALVIFLRRKRKN